MRLMSDKEKSWVDDLDNMGRDTSVWEGNFLDSMLKKIASEEAGFEKAMISERQIEVLEKMASKYNFN